VTETARTEPGKIHYAERPGENDLFALKVESLLLIAHNENGRWGAFIYWQTEPDTREITRFFNKVLGTSKQSDRWTWKAAGDAAQLRVASQILRSLHQSFGAEVPRRSPFEARFYPASGRLRLSIEKKTRVLIVDDSQTIRQLLTKVFSSDPELEVLGTIEDPTRVEEFVEKNRPDVITLDIHMPGIDGVTLLKKIFPRFKIPTVMISSLSYEDGNSVFSALEAGAVDYIQKPSLKELPDLTPMILEKIKMAARANLVKQAPAARKNPSSFARNRSIEESTIIAIGSSTGGTEALREVLTRLPKDIPPVLIVQHIPPVFSAAFAKRLNDLCPFEVKEAADGDEVRPGRVLIAPGALQMALTGSSRENYRVSITNDPPVNRHCPSVDFLFDSMVKAKAAPRTVGVILTGMGADGAKGLLSLRQNGARTIAQDEKSCVVFGMPREAIKLGAAEEVVTLTDVPETIFHLIEKKKRAA
jgi:two-component system chemotaxis response regulator CheB